MDNNHEWKLGGVVYDPPSQRTVIDEKKFIENTKVFIDVGSSDRLQDIFIQTLREHYKDKSNIKFKGDKNNVNIFGDTGIDTDKWQYRSSLFNNNNNEYHKHEILLRTVTSLSAYDLSKSLESMNQECIQAIDKVDKVQPKESIFGVDCNVNITYDTVVRSDCYQTQMKANVRLNVFTKDHFEEIFQVDFEQKKQDENTTVSYNVSYTININNFVVDKLNPSTFTYDHLRIQVPDYERKYRKIIHYSDILKRSNLLHNEQGENFFKPYKTFENLLEATNAKTFVRAQLESKQYTEERIQEKFSHAVTTDYLNKLIMDGIFVPLGFAIVCGVVYDKSTDRFHEKELCIAPLLSNTSM
jgi:hypothetical protein